MPQLLYWLTKLYFSSWYYYSSSCDNNKYSNTNKKVIVLNNKENANLKTESQSRDLINSRKCIFDLITIMRRFVRIKKFSLSVKYCFLCEFSADKYSKENDILPNKYLCPPKAKFTHISKFHISAKNWPTETSLDTFETSSFSVDFLAVLRSFFKSYNSF